MRCLTVRRKLMAYHDGELGAAASGKIRRHLETCPDCSGLIQALERGDDAAGMAGFPDPGTAYWETFTDRVMGKVRKEAGAGLSGLGSAPSRTGFSPLRLVPALSVALVVVVAAGILMKVRQPPAPKLPFTSGEKAAEKEIPPASADHLRALSESKEALYSSMGSGTAPAEKVSEKTGTEEVRESSAEKTGGMSLGKRETATDESPRSFPGEGTADIPAQDGDGSLSAGMPAQIEQDASRILAPAPSREVSSLGKTEKSSIPDGAADDGSWGQLLFARQLAQQGKNRQSEEVLTDLLERNFEPPVQEEASLLLVAVLSRQDRVSEARKVLENAQRQFPSNAMIQGYRLGEE